MFKEAVEDGIRHWRDKYHETWYAPKCCICGAEIASRSYIRGNRYTCKDCKLAARLHDKEQAEVLDKPLRDKRLDAAIKRISSVSDIRLYEESIRYVRTILYEPKAFDSTEEVMVALELGKCGIAYRHQVRFGTQYRADFVLDSMKTVLEVDGRIFHNDDRKQKENIRDGLILLALGHGWEIVRIDTDLINENVTRLKKAIDKVIERRRMERAANNGAYSHGYSNRTI